MSASTGVGPVKPNNDIEVVGRPEAGTVVDAATGEAPPTPARSTGYWIGVLVILALLSEEVAYAFNLVTPALPQMATAFGTTQIAWVSTLFSLAGAISAPLIGKLADRQGKKKWLLITAGAMAVGSAIVALAPTFEIALVGRTIEGFGIAIVPITYSLMRDIFPKKLMALAVSVATAGIGITTIVGPIFAGLLIDNFGYRGVFTALAVFPVVIGAALFFVVPETPIRVRTSIDWVGGLLLGASIGVLLYALGEGATWGWDSATFVLVAGLGVLLLVGWGFYERRITEPLIDLVVLRSRGVVTTVIAQFTGQAVIVIQFVLLAYIVQTPIALGLTYGLGQDASYMARITAVAGVASVAMGFLVGWLAERSGARLPNLAGFALMALGSASLAVQHDTTAWILIGYLVYGFGGGLVSAAIPNLVISATPLKLQAVTATTVGVVGSLGSAVAVQLIFVILGGNVINLVEGAPIYGGGGFTAVYWLATGLAVVGLVATAVMRHGRRPASVEAAA
ncbi:MFS transporter [Klenkia sp. LSe6-5]|uniref:MFS transporter n=1 Tax=Klenkia sesuvii TaxID=3103137 RepID=A0ABU8DZ99_9ACTN